MTTNSVTLFINPTAGRGRAGRRLPRIVELIEETGIPVVVEHSRSVGDLEDQVCEHVRSGARQLIIAGGDGSIHEAVNGLMTAGGEAAIGIVPCGTGNDFAKAAHIPLDWEAAATLLAKRIADHATPRPIDIGRMNDRYFANGAGIGLDAKVTQIARAYRWPIGDLVYLFAILRALVDGVATPALEIYGDGQLWNGPVTLASISNGPWIGGMFHIAPMAANDDERLELLIAAPVSRLRILQLLPKLMRGKHMAEPEISHASVTRLSIRATSPVPWHLDGEVQTMQAEFEVEILEGALKLL